MDFGNIINADEDTARKSLKLFNIIKDFQNWFMEIEKVSSAKVNLIDVLSYSLPPALNEAFAIGKS